MPCAEILSTQAFIDGEAVGGDAEAAERHLETCAECHAFVADAAALSDSIYKTAPRYLAPAALRERIVEDLDEEEARSTAILSPARRVQRRGFWLGALSGASATGLAAAVAMLSVLPPTADGLVARLTDAHTHALMSGQEIAVVSSDHHTVKPWFAGKIGIAPPVTDFTEQGYKLTGGRLDRAAGASAAVVVYQHGRHEIDLFVWADRGDALPSSGLHHGYHSIFWKRGDLDFAAVSDTAPAELATFSNLVRAQPE